MISKTPLVSIGMPTYNGEAFIREALDSLLAQDFKDFELIISDNASKDNTAKICKAYTKRDSRVKYYRNKENIGSNANFNKVLELARGKYFMWAADDDVWEPSFVSSMAYALEHNPKAVLSFCQFDVIDLNGKLAVINDYDPLAETCKRDLFNRLLPRCLVELWGANMAIYIYGLIKKDILLKCGGLNKKVDAYTGADLVTIFHLLSYGPFISIDKRLFHRRDNTPRLNAMPSFIQKLKKRSLVSLLLEWRKKVHQYYHAQREIVGECALDASRKIILITILYAAELRHYARSSAIRLRDIFNAKFTIDSSK